MNIYVGNLSFDAGEEDIRKVFEEFGSVDTVKIVMDRFTNRSKGFGFVEMTNDEEAKKAISKLDGKEHLGRALKVNAARPREERNSRSW
ncbi:MAG: RNA-binding protein [Candidatus Thermoplasmatota archaeon]|nr:RNA-binding protein [Candidatus Thermoplasmatota archaeon]